MENEESWIDGIEIKDGYLHVPISCPLSPEEVLEIAWSQLRQIQKELGK